MPFQMPAKPTFSNPTPGQLDDGSSAEDSAWVRFESPYLMLLIHLRIGPETVLSGLSIENTSDIWLSPFSNSIVGQCSGPDLQSSSCKAWLNALLVPLMPG